jgi:hypothetical protein
VLRDTLIRKNSTLSCGGVVGFTESPAWNDWWTELSSEQPTFGANKASVLLFASTFAVYCEYVLNKFRCVARKGAQKNRYISTR